MKVLEPFPIRYRRALADERLQTNLLMFQRKWRGTRDAALESVDFAAEREHLKNVKNDVIEHLPDYLNQFTAAVESQGGTVFRARTPDDAIEYIVRVARARGTKRVVKSKSMVSEEIELNRGLERASLEVVETDLGEWLIQLAGERPSHLVAPAIHMNRRQTAELLSPFAGRALGGDDIGEQVVVAREHLRQRFLAGEIGISGANALVAETGSVVIVTNEGNAELVTSIPPVHIILAGIEKLVPTIEEALTVLRLLAPSAAGQQASSYVSWITGPTAPNGELHVVLLDNGRTEMRESPLFADALRCIRCGACSNVCPSYGVVGGHVFGYVYSGAIGLVNTPFHHGIEHDVEPQSLCVQCNACQTVCPVDIPLPRQILDARSWSVREAGMPLAQRAALALWRRPRLFAAGARAGRILQAPVRRGDFLEPPGLRRWTSWRKPPALARRPFRDLWPIESPALPGPLGRTLEGITVAYFVQCLTDQLYPAMAEAIVGSLQSLGARVVFPRAQHCCGLPAADSGDPDTARAMAKQTIRTLQASQADYIVTGATSCVVAVLNDYAHLFAHEPEWQIAGRALAGRFFDFTSFLDTVARLPAGSLVSGTPMAASYHYFCQSYNVLGFREEPLRLLRDVCGVDMAPLPEATVCCGFGGSVSLTRPEMSERILARKLDNVCSTGAMTLVTDNPGCIMHLRGGLAARGEPIRVLHTAEVVSSHIGALRRVLSSL